MEPEAEQLVRTSPLCSMSRMLPLPPDTVPEEVVALAPVKVTEPKLAKETRLEPDSKSSTIHSASVWHKEPKLPSLLKVWLTDLPVVLFLTVAVPLQVKFYMSVAGSKSYKNAGTNALCVS